MATVKWIKLVTDIFDDEKILMIETLPSADSIIVIWFKLLCFAGKTNNDGVFMMSNRIAYTDEMLSAIFRRDVNTVRMALSVFEQYGMIEVVDDVITIPNWNKHQSLDAYEKKKERDRIYKQEQRAKTKAFIEEKVESRRTVVGQVVGQSGDTSSEVASLDIEEEREEEKEHLSKDKCKHRHGEYKNVLLTDDELEKLKDEYPDYQERIERLSSYVASTGKRYKSHYATIRNWARKDAETKKTNRKADELDDFYYMASNWADG